MDDRRPPRRIRGFYAIQSRERHPYFSVDPRDDEMSSAPSNISPWGICVNVCAIIVVVMIILGMLAGAFLVMNEANKTEEIDLKHNMVLRNGWNASVPRFPLEPFKWPTSRILILATNTTRCETRATCSHLMRQLQDNHMWENFEGDIWYNFVICGEGNIYEGRGWNYRSAIKSIPGINQTESIYIIAFAGTFSEEPPNYYQVDGARALIEKAIEDKYLNSTYSVIIEDEMSSPLGKIAPKLYRKGLKTMLLQNIYS